MDVSDSTLDENFLFGNFEDQPVSKSKSKKSRKRKLSDSIQGDGVELSEDVSKAIEQKDKYIQQLEDQNNRLKAVIKRLCGPQTLTERGCLWEKEHLETMPMAVVLYVNNELSVNCQKEVEETMVNLVSRDHHMKDKIEVSQDFKSQHSAVPLRAFAADTKGKRSHIAKKVMQDSCEPHIYSAIHYYIEFCIDRTGLPLLENNPGITELWSIPVYEQVFFNALPALDDDGRKVFVRQNRTKYCFNCLGDHTVSQCDQPKDPAKINSNRQEFMNKFSGSPINESRYHQGDQERFKDFKAGMISDNLREALMIKKEDLPPYIYKMRVMGYPPGYLKTKNSGLLMYGKGGKVQDSYDGEEGEIQPDAFKREVRYPGFNAPLEQGVIDRSAELGMQPFVEYYSEVRNKTNYSESYQDTPDHQEINQERAINDDMEVDESHNNPGGYLQSPIEVYPVNEIIKKVTSSPGERNVSVGTIVPPRPDCTPEKVPPPPSHEPAASPLTQPSLTSVEIGELLEKAEMRVKKSNLIDTYLAQGSDASRSESDTSHRKWWNQEPLSTLSGIIYHTCTPPPTVQKRLEIADIFEYTSNDLDREPWKTDSTSWYDPLYGDLAAPTGIYDTIKEILKKRKIRERRKRS